MLHPACRLHRLLHTPPLPSRPSRPPPPTQCKAGVHAGLRSDSHCADVALLVSERAAAAAGDLSSNSLAGASATHTRGALFHGQQARAPEGHLVAIRPLRISDACSTQLACLHGQSKRSPPASPASPPHLLQARAVLMHQGQANVGTGGCWAATRKYLGEQQGAAALAGLPATRPGSPPPPPPLRPSLSPHAASGQEGLQDARRACAATADALGLAPHEVLIQVRVRRACLRLQRSRQVANSSECCLAACRLCAGLPQRRRLAPSTCCARCAPPPVAAVCRRPGRAPTPGRAAACAARPGGAPAGRPRGGLPRGGGYDRGRHHNKRGGSGGERFRSCVAAAAAL